MRSQPSPGQREFDLQDEVPYGGPGRAVSVGPDPLLPLRHFLDVEISLGEGNTDVRFRELLVDQAIHLVEDPPPVCRIGDPAEEIKVQAGVSKLPKADPWLRAIQDFRMVLPNIE